MCVWWGGGGGSVISTLGLKMVGKLIQDGSGRFLKPKLSVNVY